MQFFANHWNERTSEIIIDARQFYDNRQCHIFFAIFRRDTKDTEWIRILTLLDVGTKVKISNENGQKNILFSPQMYNDMTPENMDKRCPAKIICQAFESREIIGNFKPLF